MAKLFPIWESFAAGEISPRLFNRTSAPIYQQGLALCENCLTTSHGPVQRRGGTLYMTQNESLDARLLQFNHRKNVVYLLALLSSGEMIIVDVSHGQLPVVELIITTPWDTEEKVRGVQTQMLPTGGIELIMTEESTQIQQLTYDPDGATAVDRWELDDWDTDNTPSEWVGSNWPSAITLYQGRMWFAATPDGPEHIWASRSGNYNNFQTGSNDDHALSFELAQQGRIEWMVGTKTLICGTVNGEHIVTRRGGTNEDPITAANVNALQQSGYGSLPIQPPRIGQLVIYVSPDGKKVRDIGYKWEEDGWLSRDITFMSEHMAKKDPVRELTFAQHPENTIYAVTRDGHILGATYDLEADVIGWHRHDTQGEVKSMISIDIEGSSDVFMAVFRKGEMYLERLVPNWEDLSQIGYPLFADSCGVIDHTGAPSAEITGLLHLADEEVVVTVDGATHPPVTLDENGDATLQYAGETIIVGLRFTPHMITLPLDRDMPNEAGTTRPHMKRYNKIYVRVISSAKPIINGKRPPDRSPATPMNEPEPFSSDDFIVVNLGWDRFAQIDVIQDLPVDMVIAGIYGETAVENVS